MCHVVHWVHCGALMVKDVLRENLSRHIQKLEEAKLQLLGRIRSIDEDLAALLRADEVLVRTAQIDAGLIIDSQDSDAHESVPAGEPSLIAGCQSMIEACEILADANGGLLRLTPAAREIRRAGLSRASTTASVSATIHGYLKKRIDDWEHAGPGVWRRKGRPNGLVNDRPGDPSTVVGSCESETGGEMTMN